jgi:hypothetical protein
MKWAFYLWLLLTLVGATVMGWAEGSTPHPPKSMHIICQAGECEIEGNLHVGPSISLPYRGGEEMQGKQHEFSIDEAVEERSDQ